MKRIFFYCCFMLLVLLSYGQTGKYFTASQPKCGSFKVFIDYRVQQYCDGKFSIAWDGTCKSGYADGEGKLTLVSTVKDRSFTMSYEGKLVKGKKEGHGILNLFVHYPGFQPYYSYSGGFRNDEFDGYGEFRSDYPYPVEPDKIGLGVSLELLGLDLPIWRSDLFFYEYTGNFLAGKIADAENGTGKTKRMTYLTKAVSYKGAIRNGRPNGKGVAKEETMYIYPNMRAYASMTGNFVDGVLNGVGKQIGGYFEYEGEFVNGIREGKGKMTEYKFVGFLEAYRNKSVTEGKQMSMIIEGNFVNGNASGICTILFQHMSAYKYSGPMKNGLMHGTGEIEFINGSKLRGNFSEGSLEGQVSYQFNSGDRFTGIFKDNTAVTGVFIYKDGSKYEGAVAERLEVDKNTGEKINIIVRQGRGTYTDKDGKQKTVVCDNDNCTETN